VEEGQGGQPPSADRGSARSRSPRRGGRRVAHVAQEDLEVSASPQAEQRPDGGQPGTATTPDADQPLGAAQPLDADPPPDPGAVLDATPDTMAPDLVHEPVARTALPILDGRSTDPATCPFLRSQTPEGVLLAPVEAPSDVNHCLAGDAPLHLSQRQQELVCLNAGHADCPRYLRGTLLPGAETPPTVEEVTRTPRQSSPRARRGLTVPTLAALVLLAASAAGSFAFLVARGGITMPVAPTSTPVQVAAITSIPSVAASAPAPTSGPTPSPLANPTPVPSVTPEPTPSPTIAPPTPRPTAPPRPSSDRYQYLDPCPDRPNCWFYTIRAGDALYNLARYFGHPLERVYQLNPWAQTRGIHPGDKLILPPPTR